MGDRDVVVARGELVQRVVLDRSRLCSDLTELLRKEQWVCRACSIVRRCGAREYRTNEIGAVAVYFRPIGQAILDPAALVLTIRTVWPPAHPVQGFAQRIVNGEGPMIEDFGIRATLKVGKLFPHLG